MGTGNRIFIPAFLSKYLGTWNLAVCNNSNDAAYPLKSFGNRPYRLHAGTTGISNTLKEVFTIKGSNIFNQDKIAEQLTKLKTMVKKPWMEGRLEYTMLPDGTITGVNFVECAGGKIIIIELPDKEPDGSISNNLYVGGVDSIDQGQKDSLVKDGSKLACAIKKRFSNNMFSRTSNLYVCFYNERSDDVRWDYENVLKISMLYHARLNVEYTKINIIAFSE
jgi:hypothetical protein